MGIKVEKAIKSAAYWLMATVPLLLLLGATEWYLRGLTRQHLEEKLGKNAALRKSVLIHEKSADPILIYQLKPHGVAHQHGVTYQINGEGFRDEEFGAPSKNRINPRKRILVLGDSVAWGWGVEMDKAWPQLLEAQLEKAYPGEYEVMNMAVNGYNTPQEVRVLETIGLAYEPDLIILHYVLNDAEQEDGGLSWYFKDVNRFELKLQARMLWGFTRLLIEQKVNQWMGHQKKDSISKQTDQKPAEQDHYYLTHETFWSEIQNAFDKLKKVTTTRQIPVTVIISPVFDYPAEGSYPWLALHKKIETLSKAEGFEFIDTLPLLKKHSSADISFDSIHPNILGHEIIAGEVAQKLSLPK